MGFCYLNQIAVAALHAQRALGARGGGGEESQSATHWSATLMAQPFGRWLLAGVSVAIVAFEFILGALTGQSWRQMLAAYDVRTGTLWPAVPLFVAIAPAIFHRLQQDLS